MKPIEAMADIACEEAQDLATCLSIIREKGEDCLWPDIAGDIEDAREYIQSIAKLVDKIEMITCIGEYEE